MQTCSEQLNELFTALAKAQGQITTAIKDASNPFFKSQYTTLDGCWTACRGPLSSNGLSIVQTIKEDAGKFYLTTVLGHASGQFISSMMPLMLAKNDPQAFGSACSYARRYSLCAIVGLTQGDDDDGEKAMVGHRVDKKPKHPDPVIEDELADDDFYNALFPHMPNYNDPSFGSEKGMKEYLNSLATEKLSVQKIIKQAMRSEEMMKRFCSSWLAWHKQKT